MRSLVYALRFRGHATWAGADGNVLETAASAPGRTIRSRIGADDLIGTLKPALGDEATHASELALTGASTF